MYFPSFKWLRLKFEMKVQRRRNKLEVANSGTLTNSQNENPLIVVEYIINITDNLLSRWTTVCLHLFPQKLPQLIKTMVYLSQKSQLLTKNIAKCNEKSIKHNCDIENEVK